VFILSWFAYSATRFSGPFFANLTTNLSLVGRYFEQGRVGDALGSLVGVLPGLVIVLVLVYRLAKSVPSVIRRTRPAESSATTTPEE
jgi:hypothetical protein